MQEVGYFVAVSGKDDLTKKHGCGIDGEYRANELGFDDQRRCKGKGDNIKPYPQTTDPYAVYLSNQYHLNANGSNETEWEIMSDCFDDCCEDHACPQSIPIHSMSYEDNYITQNTLKMMDAFPRTMPWFLQINWAGPHPPFIILDSMNESVNDRTYPYPMHCDLDAGDMSVTRRDYSAEIENLDNEFSKILSKIREIEGQYENTLICVSSDHGEMLGDYNVWDKSKPWVASTNVPLVCMGPKIEKNKVIESYVTNMDLAATFLDYSRAKSIQNMTSVSLRPWLNGTWSDKENDYRKYVLSGLGNWRMIVQYYNESATFKFVCCQGQCPGRAFEERNGLVQLLFNVKQDLYEETDIMDANQDIALAMRKLLTPNFCVPGNYTKK